MNTKQLYEKAMQLHEFNQRNKEPMAPVDSSWDFEDGDDYDDDNVDDDAADCGIFPDDSVWTCLQIGSEPCEFYPYRRLVGTDVGDDDDDPENATVLAPAGENQTNTPNENDTRY